MPLLVLLALLLLPSGADADVTLAIFADVDLKKPMPGHAAAAALAPTAVILAGDYDHRNPKTAAAMIGMHQDVTAAMHIFGATPILSIPDDHDGCGVNNSSAQCPTMPLALALWPQYRAMCADTQWPLNLSQRCPIAPGLLEIFLLDTRANRVTTNDASRTLLGPAQYEKLVHDVRTSTAVWKLLVSSVPMNPTVTKDRDSWQGFHTERQALVADLIGVSGIVIVSGDLHSGGKFDDGTRAHWPELNVPRANGVFVAGGWNSGVWTFEHPDPLPGFGWIAFTPTHATLSIRTETGTVRFSATVTPAGSVIPDEPDPGETPAVVTQTFERTTPTMAPITLAVGEGFACMRRMGHTAFLAIQHGEQIVARTVAHSPAMHVPFTLTCARTLTEVTLALNGIVRLRVAR